MLCLSVATYSGSRKIPHRPRFRKHMLGHTNRGWDSFVLWAAETRSTRGNGENPNVVADLLQMGEGGKVGLGILWYCHFHPHPCRAIRLLLSLVSRLDWRSPHLPAEHPRRTLVARWHASIPHNEEAWGQHGDGGWDDWQDRKNGAQRWNARGLTAARSGRAERAGTDLKVCC